MINIKPLKAYTDNYIWLLETNEDVSVVDPGDASPVLKYLEKYNKNLKDILITHHHFDHTAGVPGRNEIDQTQELFYPAIMKAILSTGFEGFVAQEFIPKGPNPIKSLDRSGTK